MARTFKVGEKYIITDELPQCPLLGEVFVLTDEPYRTIGLKLPHKVEGAHSLNGRVENGTGIWARPEHLHSEEEWNNRSLTKQAAPPESVWQEFSELELDDTGRPVLAEPLPGPAPTTESVLAEPVAEPKAKKK